MCQGFTIKRLHSKFLKFAHEYNIDSKYDQSFQKLRCSLHNGVLFRITRS